VDRHEDAFGGIDNTRAHERDYDGTNTLRGFRWGLALAGLLWIGIGAAACAELDVKSAEGARVVAKTGANCGDVPLPPPEFDHDATIPVMVQHVPFDLVDGRCRAHGVAGPRPILASDRHGTSAIALLSEVTHGDFETKACSWTQGRLGLVILPETGKAGVTQAWEACVMRHEIGHINGWPPSHPRAHYEGSALTNWL